MTVLSFWAARAQTFIDDRQFIDSMIPHHSGAILMWREADIENAEPVCVTVGLPGRWAHLTRERRSHRRHECRQSE